jgi:uncharacterized protein YbcV (DUF1398 family)
MKGNRMDTQLLHETLAKSLAGTITFPEVVRVLTAEGVESYRADLVRLEETFYMPDRSTHVEKMACSAGPIGDRFATDKVVAAIHDSQTGKCKYREFLGRVMEAGTTSYVTYLKGRKVIYFGRHGDFHIEEFPRVQS